jgi:hypothetical protein
MSVNSGRDIGEQGDLLLSLGVHGIQAIPAVALLASAAGLIPPTTWLHAAGIGWLAAFTAALTQAILGHPTMEPSILTALIVAGLALWAAAAGRALISWRQPTTHTPRRIAI